MKNQISLHVVSLIVGVIVGGIACTVLLLVYLNTIQNSTFVGDTDTAHVAQLDSQQNSTTHTVTPVDISSSNVLEVIVSDIDLFPFVLLLAETDVSDVLTDQSLETTVIAFTSVDPMVYESASNNGSAADLIGEFLIEGAHVFDDLTTPESFITFSDTEIEFLVESNVLMVMVAGERYQVVRSYNATNGVVYVVDGTLSYR